MPSLTSGQKAAVQQFVALTSASDKTATQYLKAAVWRLESALDAYFEGNPNIARPGANAKAALETLFDSLINVSAGDDTKTTMGLDSTMGYIEKLGIDPDKIDVLVLFELVKSPTVGVIKKEGFVNGWMAVAGTPLPSQMPTDIRTQAAYIRNLVARLSSDLPHFKRVYRHTFLLAREESQRAIPLETATTYWDILFRSPGRPWVGSAAPATMTGVTRNAMGHTDWLATWKGWLEKNWTMTISKDMWDQTLEFANKSMADGTLSFWNPDGPWPRVVDDFVEWCLPKQVQEER